MSDRLHLRDYQTECLTAVWDAWANGMQRPSVVLPTGSGKTVIFSHLAEQFIRVKQEADQPHRVMILVHRDELADQAVAKVKAVAPHLTVGKVKAESDDIHADVMVCSVQTLARGSRMFRLQAASWPEGRGIGLVIVDEAHHAAADSYQRILQSMGCFTGIPGNDGYHSGTYCLGVTATMARGDGVGLGDTWEDVVFLRSVLWMISRNYLTDVRGMAVDLEYLNLNGVKRSGGDYQSKALGEAILAANGHRHVARAVQVYAPDRRPIVFLPDVASAYATAEELRSTGTSAAVIDGKTRREDRLRIYQQYREGAIRALVNCMVLTEGADFPWADCIVNARPTTNPTLYIQMIGRGLRPWPGKTDCLVLDVTGSGGKISTLVDLAPGEVTSIRESESLADAAVRTEEEANTVVKAGSVAFDLRHRDLDLFASSSQAWLRTAAGVMFIPTGDAWVFLWPGSDGDWDVCSAPRHGKWERLHTGMQLGTAMAWAETEADDRMAFNTSRDARWRKGRAEPRQIAHARSWRVEIPGDPRKGALSDAVSIVQASQKFDPYVRRVGQ